MKKAIIIPIVLGSTFLLAGSIIFAIGVATYVPQSGQTVTKEYVVEAFNNVYVDVQTSNIEFIASSDSERKVICEEREKEYHTVEVKDGSLNINSVNDRKWYEYAFNWNFKPMKVTIYAPAGDYSEVSIKTSTGDIAIPNDYSFSSLNVATDTGNSSIKSNVKEATNVVSSTGSISLELNTKLLAASSSTGKVTLNNVNVSEDINIKTSTGDVYLTNVSANNLTIEGSTADKKLTNTIVAKHTKLKSSTGDVDLIDSDSDTFDIETSTGHVKGTILTNKIFDAKSDTGKVDVPLSGTGGLCKIRTSTGSIEIKIKE